MECENDLPTAMQAVWVDAVVFEPKAVQASQRLAAACLSHPVPLTDEQRRMCDDCMRGVLMHWQQFEQPPPATLEALSTALTAHLVHRWAPESAEERERVDPDEDGEEFISMALACAAHFAEPQDFERLASAASRNFTLGAAGLAAAAILCSERGRAVSFLRAGGADVLLSIVNWPEAPTRARATAVKALVAATRFPDACHAMVDSGFGILVAPLLYPCTNGDDYTRMTTTVFTRCTVYALASSASDAAKVSAVVPELTVLLRLLRRNEEDSTQSALSSHIAGVSALSSTDAAVPHIMHATGVVPAVVGAMRAGSLDHDAGCAFLAECGCTLPGLLVLCAHGQALLEARSFVSGAAVWDFATVAALGGAAVYHLRSSAVQNDLHIALLAMARLCRHPTQCQFAALLLSADGVPAALVGVIERLQHSSVDEHLLACSLAVELLVTLARDSREVCMAAWLPLAERLHASVQRLMERDQMPRLHVAALRDWAAAGMRCHSAQAVTALALWLSQLESGEDSASGAPLLATANSDAGTLGIAAGGLAGISAGAVVGMHCALRLLNACTRASEEAATTLFGADILGVATRVMRRSARVLSTCGVCGDSDAAALEEDVSVGPELGPVRRCTRAAQLLADAAQLTAAVLLHMKASGVTTYRATATVDIAIESHAAAAVLHFVGGPAGTHALLARRAAASVCALWATGPPEWRPRLLGKVLKAAGSSGKGSEAADAAGPPVSMGPSFTLATWLLIGDVLPPAAAPSPLSPASRQRLCEDMTACEPALTALLVDSVASVAPAVLLAATRALLRLAAVDRVAVAVVSRVCWGAVGASTQGTDQHSRIARLVQMLAHADVLPDDAAALEKQLRARVEPASSISDATVLACAPYIEEQPAAALARAVTGGDASTPKLVAWYMRDDSVAADADLARRRRVQRAELLSKRGPAKAALTADAAFRPAVRRKTLAGGAASRTIHVDDFEAMEKARKAETEKPPPAAAAPAAPLPPVAPVAAAPSAAQVSKPMLSIKFGAAASTAPPQPLAELAPPSAALAEQQHLPMAAEPPFFGMESDTAVPAFDAPHTGGAEAQAVAQAAVAAAPPPAPAGPVIPGLGGVRPVSGPAASMIPGLGGGGFAPPGLGVPPPPRAPAALPPPRPPSGPPPPGTIRAAAAAPPPPPPQSAALLQQMLASPEAINALLNDPERLRALLEQFPQLAEMLQARLRGA